jgi:hypothetical protein
VRVRGVSMKILVVLILLALLFIGVGEKIDNAINEAFGIDGRDWFKFFVIGATLIAIWTWFY